MSKEIKKHYQEKLKKKVDKKNWPLINQRYEKQAGIFKKNVKI